jgi:hypothetical protein
MVLPWPVRSPRARRAGAARPVAVAAALSFRAAALGSIFAFIAAVSLSAPALAADPSAPAFPLDRQPAERVSVSAGISGGVGVLVLDWPRPVLFSAAIAEGRLTLRFARPFEAGFAPAVSALAPFLAAGGLYPDRRTAAFALARPDLALRASHDGARVVVELFPLSPETSAPAGPGPREPGPREPGPREPGPERPAAAPPPARPDAKPESPPISPLGTPPSVVRGKQAETARVATPGTASVQAKTLAPGTAPGTASALAPAAPGSRADSPVERGRTLLADGRPDLALAAVAREPGEAAERLRLDAHWRRADWQAASASALKLLENRPQFAAALAAAEQRLALDAAVAATLAHDRAALESLDARFGAAMRAGAYRHPFTLLANTGPQDDPRESARRALEAAEGVQKFLAQRPLPGLVQVTE